MTRAELIKNIRVQFNRLMKFDATTELTTGDGKTLIVMGEDAAEGVQVYLLDADNNQTDCPDGDYILSDGRTITVTGGVITAIKQADAPTEAPAEMATEPATPDATAADPDAKQDEDLANRISALEEAVNQILEMLQGSMSKQEQSMSIQKELEVRFSKFAEQPSEKPIVLIPKINNGNTTALSMDEILEAVNKKRK